MKVYLFNTVSGVYGGEDFCEDRYFDEGDGMTALAPPDSKPGHLIVYDTALRKWTQAPVDPCDSDHA